MTHKLTPSGFANVGPIRDRGPGSAEALEVVGFLDGIRVIDFGQYVAGPVAAMFLADQGADVVRVERPGGPSFNTPANATWNRGKRSICLDLANPTEQVTAKGLMAKADVVIENFRPGVMDRLGLGYRTTRTLNPGLIYASMPAFGPRDRRRNVQGWEGVVLAAADVFRPRTDYQNMLEQIYTDPINRAGKPVFSNEPIASMYAALIAKMGIMAALTVRETSGQGQYVEAPLFDSFMQSVGRLGMAKIPFRKPPTASLGPWNHQYVCADGRWIHVTCSNQVEAEALVGLIAKPELTELGLTDPLALRRSDQAEQIREALTEAFIAAPAAEWEALFEAKLFPGAMCRTTQEWLEHPQANAGLTVSVVDRVLGPTKQPVPIVAMANRQDLVHRPAPGPDEHRQELLSEMADSNPFEATDVAPIRAAANLGGPLNGVRVLDLSLTLAGSSCGRTLAELGADVIKVDDPKRSDIPFHQDANRGKRSILLDLSTNEGLDLCLDLIDRADVIVENYPPGVTSQLGIDYESIKDRRPEIIYGSMTAFGRQGPWATMPGSEETVEAATGLQSRFGGERSPRVWPICTINDYGTGLATANGILAALLDRTLTGKGQLVEGALARTAGILQSTNMIQFESQQFESQQFESQKRPGTQPNETQSRSTPNPTYGLYQCQDRWIFLGATTREALLPLLGERVESTDGFVLQLTEWCRRRPAAEAVRILIEQDIGAQELLWLNDVMMDPQVAGAGLSVVRDHGGVGLLRTTGPGTWLSESTVAVGRPASVPGSDIESVLKEIGRDGDLDALGQHRTADSP